MKIKTLAIIPGDQFYFSKDIYTVDGSVPSYKTADPLYISEDPPPSVAVVDERILDDLAAVADAAVNLLGQFDQAHTALGVERSPSSQEAIKEMTEALAKFAIRGVDSCV
jgi:hypothetical protein